MITEMEETKHRRGHSLPPERQYIEDHAWTGNILQVAATLEWEMRARTQGGQDSYKAEYTRGERNIEDTPRVFSRVLIIV